MILALWAQEVSLCETAKRFLLAKASYKHKQLILQWLNVHIFMSLHLQILLHLYIYVSEHYFAMIRAGVFGLFTVLLKLIASELAREFFSTVI